MRTTFTNTAQDRDFMNTVIKALQTEVPKKALHEAKKQLNEKLDPDEADEVEYAWDHSRDPHVEDTIDKVFQGKSRIEYPLEGTEVVPHPDVEEHLNNNGFKVTDYINGKAKDKYNREVNIGKALVKTKAPEQVKAAYDNDPTRQQKGKALKVVISHKPVDVAGMTSGHQSWVDHSCMNFKSGSYRGFLPHEVKAGTHVAYLTDMEDHDLDRPVARIAIKPFMNNTGHLIFRPESKTYGNSNSSFTRSVHDWTENHYPAEPNTTYNKNKHVYNDTEDSYESLTHESAIDKINNGESISSAISPTVVSHITHHLLTQSEEDPSILNKFGKNNHAIPFDRNQVNALYSVAAKNNQTEMTKRLIRNSGDVLNKKNLDHAINESGIGQHINITKHRYLPQEYIDKLSPNDYESLHPANIKPHHVDKVLDALQNKESGSAYPARALIDHFSKDQLMRYSDINMAEGRHYDAIKPVLSHKNSDSDVVNHVFDRIKNTKSEHLKENAMIFFTEVNKNPTSEHVAHTNGTIALNNIMENAKDKLTHHLAMHKALNPKSIGRVTLGENSAKYVSDKEIPELYENVHKLNTDSRMAYGLHDKFLSHAEHKIDDLEKEYDDGDDRDRSKDDITEDMQNHFQNHAEMIGERLSDIKHDFRSGYPVDYKELDSLRDHIDHATNHTHYDGYSHEDVESDHRDIEREINRDY